MYAARNTGKEMHFCSFENFGSFIQHVIARHVKPSHET